MRWSPTSVLPVTCFVAVHWPELWLHSQSDYCGRSCSEKERIMNTHPAVLLDVPESGFTNHCDTNSQLNEHKHATL